MCMPILDALFFVWLINNCLKSSVHRKSCLLSVAQFSGNLKRISNNFKAEMGANRRDDPNPSIIGRHSSDLQLGARRVVVLKQA